ncbi:MAG: hypothetical protein JWO28_2541 [Hyphomicrobiales bacterium]|jgi:hypothetical protein|nr:hypothetical protein [Hyphomicrobiales bacterium]
MRTGERLLDIASRAVSAITPRDWLVERPHSTAARLENEFWLAQFDPHHEWGVRDQLDSRRGFQSPEYHAAKSPH